MFSKQNQIIKKAVMMTEVESGTEVEIYSSSIGSLAILKAPDDKGLYELGLYEKGANKFCFGWKDVNGHLILE